MGSEFVPAMRHTMLARLFCLTQAKEIQMSDLADEMVHLVHTRQHTESKVTLGDFVTKDATHKEKIGACFLDKINFVLEHDTIAWQPSHLAVDLAACCTIPDAATELANMCVKDITYPYDLVRKSRKVTETRERRQIELDFVSHLIVHVRSYLCGKTGKIVHCPSFQGDDHDMKLLKLCSNVVPESPNERCDPVELLAFVREGSETPDSEVGNMY